MTDLATLLADLADFVGRIGLTEADIVSLDVSYKGHATIHMVCEAAGRVVADHCDADNVSVRDYTDPSGSVTHHHRAPITGTGGRVQVLWITTPAAVAA